MPRGKVFRPIIQFAKYGCTNRPFYHLVAADPLGPPQGPIFEQLGTMDPYPNKNGEKLIALNFDRIQHWLIKGAHLTPEAKDVLGLSGFLPVSPHSLQVAHRKQIAASVHERVANGETLSEEDIPPNVKYMKYHPIYEKVYDMDGFSPREKSIVDFNNFDNNYSFHSAWSGRARELTKDFYEKEEE